MAFFFLLLGGSFQFIPIETTAFSLFSAGVWGEKKSLQKNNKVGGKKHKKHTIKDKCSIWWVLDCVILDLIAPTLVLPISFVRTLILHVEELRKACLVDKVCWDRLIERMDHNKGC